MLHILVVSIWHVTLISRRTIPITLKQHGTNTLILGNTPTLSTYIFLLIHPRNKNNTSLHRFAVYVHNMYAIRKQYFMLLLYNNNRYIRWLLKHLPNVTYPKIIINQFKLFLFTNENINIVCLNFYEINLFCYCYLNDFKIGTFFERLTLYYEKEYFFFCNFDV